MVLSPVDAPEGAAEVHPLISLTVISQPGRARGQTYYPLISFQISKPLQVTDIWQGRMPVPADVIGCCLGHADLSVTMHLHYVLAGRDIHIISAMLCK